MKKTTVTDNSIKSTKKLKQPEGDCVLLDDTSIYDLNTDVFGIIMTYYLKPRPFVPSDDRVKLEDFVELCYYVSKEWHYFWIDTLKGLQKIPKLKICGQVLGHSRLSLQLLETFDKLKLTYMIRHSSELTLENHSWVVHHASKIHELIVVNFYPFVSFKEVIDFLNEANSNCLVSLKVLKLTHGGYFGLLEDDHSTHELTCPVLKRIETVNSSMLTHLSPSSFKCVETIKTHFRCYGYVAFDGARSLYDITQTILAQELKTTHQKHFKASKLNIIQFSGMGFLDNNVPYDRLYPKLMTLMDFKTNYLILMDHLQTLII